MCQVHAAQELHHSSIHGTRVLGANADQRNMQSLGQYSKGTTFSYDEELLDIFLQENGGLSSGSDWRRHTASG